MYLFLFYVHWCLVRSPGSRVTDSCALPYGYWELNWSCLEEQSVLLTTEPSLQPWIFVLFVFLFFLLLKYVAWTN